MGGDGGAKKQIMIWPPAIIKWDSKDTIIERRNIIQILQMFTVSPFLIWMNLFDGCPSPLLYLVSREPSQWELSPSGKWWQLDYENMPSQKPSSKTSENMNMRKCKSKARFQNDFHFPVLLFMSNVGQCPLLAFCVETCDGLKCFSGECLGERGLGGGFTWKKQNQNAKYRGWVVFQLEIECMTHTRVVLIIDRAVTNFLCCH